MKLLSIGDGVLSGVYEPHSCFARAANFLSGQHLVSLVDEEIGAGPVNVVISGFSGEELNAGQRLEIGNDAISFAGRTLCFTREQRYCSSLEIGGFNPQHFRTNLAAFGRLLREESSPASLAFLVDEARLRNLQSAFERTFAAHIAAAANEVFCGDLREGVARLKGCGVGLTPSGDDFLAGLLIGLNLLQQTHHLDCNRAMDAVLAEAIGNNVFSNAFLTLARRGSLFSRMKDLITALLAGPADSIQICARKLFAIGGSSGADLGTGFYMTVRNDGAAVTRFGTKAGAA